MNHYKLFIKRIGLISVTNLLVTLSSLILLPLLTKNLTINDYGIWIQVTVTIALIPQIANLGLPYTMIRFLSGEKNRKKIQEGFYSMTSIIVLSSFLVALFFYMLSAPIANLLFNNNIIIAQIVSFIVFFSCLNAMFLNYFRTFQKMKIYSIFLFIQSYIVVILAAYFIFTGKGIIDIIIGLLITNIILFFFMFTLIIVEIGFIIPKFQNIREYFSFGMPTIPGNLSYWVVDSSDRYIIGILLGAAFVGYYAPGYTLGNFIIFFLAPFSILLPAVLPQYYDNGKRGEVRIFLKYSMKYFFLLAIPAAFGLSILSKQILMILSTPEIAINSYLITPFITLSAIMYGLYGLVSEIIILEKKTRIIGTIWIIAAVVNLILNITFVPILGIIGAAAMTLLTYTLATIITVYYAMKYFKFDFDLLFILKSIFASILMSTVIIFINPQGVLNIMITILICIIIYMGVLLILKGIKKEEFELFKELFKEA